MHLIDTIYINGRFVTPHGEEWFDLINPSTEQLLGRVRLADAEDARTAIAAAKQAFPTFSRTSRQQRIDWLMAMHHAVVAREDELFEAITLEYGAPVSRGRWMARHASQVLLEAAKVLQDYPFNRRAGSAEVVMQPLGVAGLITPWNSNAGFICGKLAAALAAGCTAVVKPSELSALQTRVVTQALHEAGLPPGVFNIVTGRGETVGAQISAHPDVAKLSFTGSTAVGKGILRAGAETLKRVTLELGGKSPVLILDDANFGSAVPMALQAGFMNSGQACIAGTRLLVPEHRLDEVKRLAKAAAEAVVVGDPKDPSVTLGPMVTRKQYERVQRYIRLGIEEGASLLTGGPDQPAGLEAGNFVKPTVFFNVTPQMTIAKDEIFGPVLSIMTYRSEEEAIAIANDTPYGLQAYVSSRDLDRANRVADQLQAGRVHINGMHEDMLAPFGGFKQSGLGREFGAYGLEAYLEPKAILGTAAQYQ